MGFGGILALVVALLMAAVCANGYYTATRRPSLVRDLIVRALLVETIFIFPAFLTAQFMPSLALGAIVLVPITALTVAIYPLKKKFIDKRAAMM